MNRDLHIAELIARKHRGELDPEGQRELDSWLEEDPAHRELLERTGDPRQQREKLETYALFDQEKAASRLEEALFPTKTVRLNTSTFLRYAATIVLPLLILGGAAWWILGNGHRDLLADIDTHIGPGTGEAVLVLSDGSRIELETESLAGTLQEGDATIRGEERTILYQSEVKEDSREPLIYNELITPRGGSYQLRLADGSRVWLNAGSSIRFPVSFHDSIRRIYLDGEAFFEVRPSDRAFIVQSGDTETRVLGTSFNISAYPDDAFIQTTLVEGKVRVTGTDKSGKLEQLDLSPDEQAIWEVETGQLSSTGVDASGYASWVEGKMEFHHETLEQVMKRLSRWYDFEYRFENESARELSFSARLERSAQISDILEMLSLTTDVRFEYRGGRILIY